MQIYATNECRKKCTAPFGASNKKSGRTCTLPLLRIIKPPPCRCSPISNLHDSAGGFSVWHVCASNVRVYPGGLLLDAKTFRNPVLKMWVKKGLLSNRAGSYRNKMLLLPITKLRCLLLFYAIGRRITPPLPRRVP